MLGFVAGFVLGLLSFPLGYCLLPRAVVEISRRKMVRISSKSKGVELSDRQAGAVLRSMRRCRDTHWVNAIVQRIYVEVCRSYAIESRIKAGILRRLEASGIGKYIRSIDVVEVQLGKEAPYVESIQVVSDEDVQRMVASEGLGSLDDEEERLMSLEEEIRRSLGLEDGVGGDECDMDSGSGKSEEGSGGEVRGQKERRKCRPVPPADAPRCKEGRKADDGGKEGRECHGVMPQKVFERLQAVVGIDYGGGVQVSLRMELPKGMTLQTTVTISGMKGDVLVRIPSRDYDTRYEYCFLFKPVLGVTVESGISNEGGRVYFRRSISSFMERYIRQVVLRTMVYPSWSGQYLPFVVPAIKDIVHRIERVTPENHGTQVPQMVERILLYMSMDYKIVDVDGEIVHRRIGHFINGRGRILCAHFAIPRASLKMSCFVGKNRLFSGLTLRESRIMNQLYGWSVFGDVISSFRELCVKGILGVDTSLVELVFEGARYEFVRAVVRNSVVFHRNDPKSPEFVVFRIADEVLYIYQYVSTEDLEMTRRRICKLQQKLDFKPFTALGSVSLYRLLRLSKRTASSYFRRAPSEVVERPVDSFCGEGGCGLRTELAEVFEEIRRTFSAEDYGSKKMCSKAAPSCIYRVLSQDEVRVKLFSEDCGIYTVINEAENIRSIVIEGRGGEGKKGAGVCSGSVVEIEEDFIIHSYLDGETIIDVRFGKDREVLVYRVEAMEANSYGYNSKVIVYYSKSMDLVFPNYFVEAVQLRIRQDEYLSIASETGYSTSIVEGGFRKEVRLCRGAMYIEFYTGVPDDYSLTVHGVPGGEVVYDIYKIITSRKVRIVLPIAREKEVLAVVLVPKFNRNKQIHYKILSLPEQFSTEALVDCNIGLSRNMKFYCPVSGRTDSVIFWEKADDDDVKGYIENSETKVMISGSGTMRTDNREYTVYYKNKGEKKREIRVFLGVSLRKT